MANISSYLAAIMSAIYGRDVRGSIHDAIDIINKVGEKVLWAGNEINNNDPASKTYGPKNNAGYDQSYYFNTTTNDLLYNNGTKWVTVDNLEGNAITSITGPVTSGLVDTYTIHFSKAADQTFQVANGRGISSITGPTVDPSDPLKDNYTINFNDGTTLDYYINNAKSITSISGPVADPDPNKVLTDDYTINFNDGTSFVFKIDNGKGIVSISGPVSVGLVDTYTIFYNDETTQPFYVTNGKDGTTWLNGVEISGEAPASTGYTLAHDDCKPGDLYFNVSEGSVYVCDVGALAGSQSYWSCEFVMTGGGGGTTYLYGLLDVDASTVQHPVANQILKYNGTTHKWEAAYGGSGHTMSPDPASATEATVVAAVNAATSTNDEVPSLYGIQKWSNTKQITIICPNSGIGHYGIGEWQDTLNNPTAADEAAWGWWHDAAFSDILGRKTALENYGYDVDYKLVFDPKGELVTLGGYILDDTTGYLCVKFANYAVDPSNVTVGVEITLTRNDVNYPT